MNGKIRHLHCRYRLATAAGGAGALADRLDRLARGPLLQACAAALAESLGDDRRVFVLRNLSAPLALAIEQGTSDEALTRRWGSSLAAAMLRAIVRPPSDAEAVVSFADQAEYVAHFTADLARGQAWERWYYPAFAALQSQSRSAALAAVLGEHAAELPAILACLRHLGALETVLAELGAPGLRQVRGLLRAADDLPPTAGLRPIFAAALRLAAALGLARPDAPDGETLFRAYLGGRPRQPDWRDRHDLARATGAALAFLLDRGYARRPPAGASPALLGKLDAALAGLDWADPTTLRAALLEMLAHPGGPAVSESPRPAEARSATALTPRQRELLADLAAICPGLTLDPRWPDGPANALRLHAALVAHAPRWAGDPLADAIIEGLLAAWAWLRRAPAPDPLAGMLRAGDPAGALALLPAGQRDAAAPALRQAARLGAAAVELLAHLDHHATPSPAAHGEPRQSSSPHQRAATLEGLSTGCAGIFLLLRSALDARLPRLVAAGWPANGDALAALLVALGLRWAGPAGLADHHPDHGLALFAGLPAAPRLAALRETLAGDGGEGHRRFQTALLDRLGELRMLTGDELHLRQVTFEGGAGLVAGDPMARLWPCGRVLRESGDAAAALAEWLPLWGRAAGRRPTVIAGDSALLAELRQVAPDARLDESNRADVADAALPASLEALGPGYLGIPDADLTIRLAADTLMRTWARWLPRFAHASTPFLLANFVRRPGRVYRDARGLLIELEPLPLDVVLELAGYTDELEQSLWTYHGRVRFRLRGM